MAAEPNHDDDLLNQPPPLDDEDTGFGRLIPRKNPPALIGYYLGIFSLIPCLGAPLGIAALVLGIVGLKRVRRDPTVRGTAHAWVAILLGGLCGIGWSVGAILLFTSSK